MPENPKSKISNPEFNIVWLIFVFLIVFVYFSGLTIPLVGPDEPRYSQIAREMFERGDWITPKLVGFDWFEKPALLYWLQIASYKMFGVNEFAARFGSAVFGLGTIFSLWILGRSASNSRFQISSSKSEIVTPESGMRNPEFANWLALIAASSIGLLAFSRGASFDIILTFPITAALVGFFIFDQSERRSGFTFHFSLFTFYFFIGVALLAKGLVGIVFPFAIVAFYYLLSRRLPSKTFIFSLVWGTILSLLVAAVWYVPMYQANGWKFVDEFFIQHHFQRFTSDKYQHHQPFWFFFLVLPLMTIPWLPFFLASIWNFFKSQIANRKSQIPDNLSTFAFAWMIVPLVFFSPSGSKLPGYILPSLPGALILTAICVSKFAAKSLTSERVLQITAAAILVFTFVVLRFFADNFIKPETVKYMIETVNAKGFADAKFVSLYTVSHNLEFYAAGRLERETNGKLRRFDDFSVLVREIKETGGERVLVVVPQETVTNLQKESDLADIETIAENGDSAIILVKPK
jgi:4-amino-4-deoxy-L-arabinose transferase-like glycosyltransferase